MAVDPNNPKPFEEVFAEYAKDMPERPTSEVYEKMNPTFREAFPESMHTWKGPADNNGVKEPLPPIDVKIVESSEDKDV